MPVLPRVRAPELRGRGWLNTGDATLRLTDLRGRFVVLDFWTFCCVNCLHVIDELRPLEQTWGGDLVVVACTRRSSCTKQTRTRWRPPSCATRSGTRCSVELDGDPGTAVFAEPNGLCVVPADTANHLLRGAQLCDGVVSTLAGTGEAWMPAPGSAVPLAEQDVSRLSTPGRGAVAGRAVDCDGGHPPAVDVRPADRCSRRRRPGA